MKKQGKYRIIEQKPREGGGTIVRYITGYGERATLRTLKEDPADIRKSIEKQEAMDHGDRNPSPRSIKAWTPGLLMKMD